jgi:quinol monooxygenase YgiN
MYANVRSRKFKPGKVVEAAKQVEANVVPIVSKVPGFISFTVVHTGEDTFTIIGLFETQEAAETAGPQAIGWVDKNLADWVDGPAHVTNGPVLVYHKK